MTQDPSVAAIVVAYHSGADLVRATRSVLKSADVSTEVLLVNNDAADPLPGKLAQELPRTRLISPGANVGFCAAVNRALEHVTARYVLLLNPDAWIEADYLARLLAHFEGDSSIASAGGRILRSSGAAIQGGAYVDSLGLTFLAGRRAHDVGQGEPDDGRRGGLDEVFGVTAAAALYRRSALLDAAVDGEVLPSDFFMYLDDVDLAWRLRLLGYRSIVDHAAIAHHARLAAGGLNDPRSGLLGWMLGLPHRARQPTYVRILSWTNSIMMLVRNDDAGSFVEQLPAFALARRYDLLSVPRHPVVAARARLRLARLLPHSLAQRKVIQGMRRVTANNMRRWVQ